mmetsp:Transcript_22412/g.72167  ORF Transcript_22412/g.72167 Transcript_22412/m.72167 type:complete len:201 (-) Transcript_22412:229-831(-)
MDPFGESRWPIDLHEASPTTPPSTQTAPSPSPRTATQQRPGRSWHPSGSGTSSSAAADEQRSQTARWLAQPAPLPGGTPVSMRSSHAPPNDSADATASWPESSCVASGGVARRPSTATLTLCSSPSSRRMSMRWRDSSWHRQRWTQPPSQPPLTSAHEPKEKKVAPPAARFRYRSSSPRPPHSLTPCTAPPHARITSDTW